MSVGPDTEKGDENSEAARQAAAVQDRLSQDVAAWYGDRKESRAEHAAEPSRPVVERRSTQPPGMAKEPNASAPTTKPAGVRSKPFSMSYGGLTEAKYIQSMLDRRSR